MIVGLQSFAEQKQLYTPVDLKGATIGIAAESLATLSTTELTARLQSRDTKFVIVFDGPGRITESKLDDGLCRRRILSAVIECKIPFVAAPALASAQLAYMYTQQFISHAYGCEEVLLFGDVPLVSNIFGNGIETPVVLRRPSICAALKIPEQLFYESAVGAGTNVAVSPSIVAERSFDNVVTAAETAIFSGHGSFYRAAAALLPPSYVAELQRALVYVIRQPILLTDGSVALSNRFNQPVPRDIAEIVGRELPPECYFYLNKGLLGNEYLKAAAFGEFTDCYQTSKIPEVRTALLAAEEGLQKLRQQSYSLFSSSLHRYFQNKEVISNTQGGANFTRSTPIYPELSDLDEPVTAKLLVSDAVRYVKKLLNLSVEEDSKVPDKDLPAFYVKNVLKMENTDQVIVNKVQLAFREALEIAICWFMFNEKADRFMDTNEIISSMPW